MDSKDCDTLSTRIRPYQGHSPFRHCKSSVDTSIMCLPPPDVTSSSSYWETAPSTDNALHIVSCFTFTQPLPAPPAADITNCVSSVVVSNGGEWHWNKNKDVIMLPSCREVWTWSLKGVKKKVYRTQYSEKVSNSTHHIIYTRREIM